MSEHTIGTREQWQTARDELAKLEAEQADRDEKIKREAAGAALGPGGGAVRVRHRGRQEDARRALRRPLPALAYNSCLAPTTLWGVSRVHILGDGFDGSLFT